MSRYLVGYFCWWDSRHPRWFLSRMHTQTTGVMGDLFKRKKVKKRGAIDRKHVI